MGIANVGIIRAEGQRATAPVSTDLVVVQRLDATNGQYSPRNITVEDFFSGLVIDEGNADSTMGVATLALGTATVNTTAVAANSRIYLSRQNVNGSTAIGSLSVGTVTAGTSFVINALAANATVATGDTSIIAWLIIQPV